MVEQISDIKNQILEKMQQTVDERGIERMDVAEVGKLSDAVKDMAEAEKACWEAEYYRAVTEAMEDGSMGYEDDMVYDGNMGNRGRQGGSGYRRGRRGYRGQQRDSMGRYTRRGYRGRYGHDDMMQDIKDMLMSADPQEKEQLKQKLRKMADM